MKLPIGTLLQGGKYEIKRFISAGGFGCTYEGVHTMLDTHVAIKEFFVKDFCNRDEQTSHVTVGTQSKVELVQKLRRKFIDEAKALYKMQHPNIVRVLDIFEENGTAYYVMDYIDGQSLHEIVKKRGALPEQEVLGYVEQIANALKYVHGQNRLHLDIKPGNIMIDNDAIVKLIDFGASKQYDEVDGENTSTLLGKTPGYAPIEQMGNTVRTFTPATDIYALGATMYKCLTGNTPPDATLLMEEGLGDFPQSISGTTKYAIEKAMEVMKKNRPQTVSDFVGLLESQEGHSPNKKTDEPDVSKKSANEDNIIEATILINEDQEDASLEEIAFCKKHGLSTNSNIAVDLGLSVKWANHNVNAKSPAGIGTLIGWGQLVDDNQNQKFENHYSDVEECISGTCYDYCTCHNPNWRMPTKQEFSELLKNCDWEFICEGSILGYLVKSRTNDNAIFIRMTGMTGIKENTQVNCRHSGYYWTGTKSLIENNATCFALSLYWKAEHYYPISFKLAIRPVCKD